MTVRSTALAVVLAALSLSACGQSDERPAPEASATVTGAIEVRVQTIADLKPVAGEVTTRDMGEAVARTGGTLTRLMVREGDLVEAGQIIGFVQDARIGLETASYAALVRAAEAEAERAEADLRRIRSLFDQGIYAQARLDQAEAAARAAGGNLEAARAQQAASAEFGSQGAILAPSTGRILRADVPAGSVVMPGQSIATVTSGPRVVRAELPEGQAGALRVGVEVQMVPDGPGGSVLRARVAQVYPAVEDGQVVVDIDGAGLDGSLVGRRIGVRLPVGERQAIIVPRSFIVTRFGVDYVRLVAGEQAADTPVQIAPGPDDEHVEILSGLSAGDRIAPPVRGAR